MSCRSDARRSIFPQKVLQLRFIAMRRLRKPLAMQEERLSTIPDHSMDEMRFVLIGMSLSAHLLVVCYRFRHEGNVIRIISARRATKNEECQHWRQLV